MTVDEEAITAVRRVSLASLAVGAAVAMLLAALPEGTAESGLVGACGAVLVFGGCGVQAKLAAVEAADPAAFQAVSRGARVTRALPTFDALRCRVRTFGALRCRVPAGRGPRQRAGDACVRVARGDAATAAHGLGRRGRRDADGDAALRLAGDREIGRGRRARHLVRQPSGYAAGGSRRHRGCHVDIPRRHVTPWLQVTPRLHTNCK